MEFEPIGVAVIWISFDSEILDGIKQKKIASKTTIRNIGITSLMALFGMPENFV